jgi:amino acid adenylation domain-containing protein
MVVAVLGILMRGAAYVPLDLSLPDARLMSIPDSASVGCVIVDDEGMKRLAGTRVRTVQVPALPDLDTEVAEADELPIRVEPGDTAYVIYTSGSTGEPKGVVVKHSNLAALTCARRMVYPGVPRFLMVSPLAFDSSVAGIWGTLTSGGLLIIPSSHEVRDPQALVGIIRNCKATHLLCIPSLYEAILDALGREDDAAFSSMTTVIVAGETLHRRLVDRHYAGATARAALVNEYGPTETTVWASYHMFEGPDDVTIGIPAPGVDLYVLDAHGEAVPPGEEGELYIGGAGVTVGYLGREDLTKAAFVANSFDPSGSRLYRTGDRAKWRGDGVLFYLGRFDQQVKNRGQRVELLLLEATLRDILGCRDACVVWDEEAGLLAFVESAKPIDVNAVRNSVREKLAEAYVPAGIEVVADLPRTVAGKLDRVALAERAQAARREGVEDRSSLGIHSAGATSAALVIGAWAEVLGHSAISVTANFFDTGGHSLMIFRLQDSLERRLGVRPSAVDLFRHPTVLEQVALFAGNEMRPAGEAAAATAGQARSERLARAQAVIGRSEDGTRRDS